jgi:hypothetical protein
MPSPRMQFTVRGIMILVAVMGALFSIPSWLVWMEDSTYYAKGYSEDRFSSIRLGMQESEVIRILGKPLKVENPTEFIEWIYGPSDLPVSDHVEPYTLQEPVRSGDSSSYTILIAEPTGRVTFASGGYLKVNEQSLEGRNLSEIESRFGKPLKILREAARRYLIYSDTTNDGSYKVRKIGIDKANRVNNIVAGWYQD